MAPRLFRIATGRFARHAFGRFVTHAAIAFVALEAFLAVAAVLRLFIAHPYVPLRSLAARLPDVLLVFFPLSLTLVVLLSVLTTTEWNRARGLFVRSGIVGAPTLLVLAPVLAGVALLCAASLYLHGSVLPQVRYELDHLIESAPVSTELLAVRLAEDPEFVPGLRIRFDGLRDGRLENVRICTTSVSSPMAIVARAAQGRRVPDSPFLELALTNGRLVRLSEDRSVQQNARFESLALRRDARALGGEDKTELIALSYYTDQELDQLHDLWIHRFQRGVRATPKQRMRLRGVSAERWTRRQSAWIPFVVALLAAGALARPLGKRSRAAMAVVVLVSLGGIVPLQLLLESAARRGRLEPAWLAWAPAALAAGTLAVLDVARRLAWRGGGPRA